MSFKTLSKKRMIVFCLTIIFFIVFDRFFKYLAVNGFFSEPLDIAGDILKLNFAGNYNIAFSIPLNGLGLNVVIVLIILWLIYYFLYLFKKGEYRSASYLTLAIVGAMSNLLDRFKYGFVVDYLDLKYFTVFNLADVMIVGGVAGILWLTLNRDKKFFGNSRE